MPTISVNGQEVHYHAAGKPNRQLMLLIHGWSSSWYAMSPLIAPFERRYYCVAVDLPGFGESPKNAERASMERYADLLAELIRQISPNRPAVLVGHSMGG
jgi:pimeloyl-ACP methyl ester carboxylesterase